MNIIHQDKSSLTDFLIQSFTISNELMLEAISAQLERLDQQLAAARLKKYKIIKKQARTIITSQGKITFTRRYYYDINEKEYIFLLDAFLNIPKYSRISDELKEKILIALCELSYGKTRKYVCHVSAPISTVSIFNILRKTKFSEISLMKVQTPAKIYVQIDEKYLNIRGFTNKKPVYTATIFTNVLAEKSNRRSLKNRLLLFNNTQTNLFRDINYHLLKTYHCNDSTICYLSGDAAAYIRCGPDKIMGMKALYIPDKFHIQSAMLDILDFPLTKEIVNEPAYLKALIDQLAILQSCTPDKKSKSAISKLQNILKHHQNGLKLWFKDYPGCSQEAMISHYLASRMAKLPNTFSSASTSRLLAIIQAVRNGSAITLNFFNHFYSLDSDFYEYNFMNYREKNIIDVNNYRDRTKALLKAINYS